MTAAEEKLPADVLAAIRAICLAYPEAEEQTTWGHPTFRVRNKIFASAGLSEDDDTLVTMAMKVAAGEQRSLLATGHPFFMPRYVGSKGWIGVVVDSSTDWDEIAELVDDSYREIAPKRLIAELEN